MPVTDPDLSAAPVSGRNRTADRRSPQRRTECLAENIYRFANARDIVPLRDNEGHYHLPQILSQDTNAATCRDRLPQKRVSGHLLLICFIVSRQVKIGHPYIPELIIGAVKNIPAIGTRCDFHQFHVGDRHISPSCSAVSRKHWPESAICFKSNVWGMLMSTPSETLRQITFSPLIILAPFLQIFADYAQSAVHQIAIRLGAVAIVLGDC